MLLAWAYLLSGAAVDMRMAGMAMEPVAWTPPYALLMFVMWWIMMVAMMLPGAAPMVLLFITIKRRQDASTSSVLGAGIFVIAYLLVWGAFSLVATLAQWGLEQSRLVSMGMTSPGSAFAGIIMLLSGLYQFTPLKALCLRYCQNPILFLSSHWRSGVAGAIRMGVVHGAYCTGCCWFLMALLFVGGIMNPVWIAAIAVYVALEKVVLATSPWLRLATGAALTSIGAFVLIRMI